MLDTRPDEKERGITIKSTAISMYFKLGEEEIKSIKQKTQGPFIYHHYVAERNDLLSMTM